MSVFSLLLSGCSSHHDLGGKELSAQAEAALATCNHWLNIKMRGTLGDIDPSQAAFVVNGRDQLDIAWHADTKVGQGTVVCSTDGTGTYVKGAEIDGIKVTP